MASEKHPATGVHAFTPLRAMNNEHPRSVDLKALAKHVLERSPQCSQSVDAGACRERPDQAEPVTSDPAAGDIVAVLIRSTVLDGALLWLVADVEALAAHPDIARSGHAVFFFDEVEPLRGKAREELRAIGVVKAAFPTSRVLQ